MQQGAAIAVSTGQIVWDWGFWTIVALDGIRSGQARHVPIA